MSRRAIRCRCGQPRTAGVPLCATCLAQLPGNLRLTLAMSWEEACKSLDRPRPPAPRPGPLRLA